MILIAEITARRSVATGACSAITVKHRSSSSRARRVVLVVAEDHVLGGLEVHREQDIGGTRDQFGDPGRHSSDPGLDLVELQMELGTQLVHQPNRPVT